MKSSREVNPRSYMPATEPSALWLRALRGVNDEPDPRPESPQALVIGRVDEVVLLEDATLVRLQVVGGKGDPDGSHGGESPVLAVLPWPSGLLQNSTGNAEDVAPILAL